MIDHIKYFDGTEYEFLSNFYPSSIEYKEQIWPTVEHAYQAEKFTDEEYRQEIHNATSPGHAKWLGQRGNIRTDWEEIKIDIMENLLRLKFTISELRQKLIDTGNATLTEGNTWGDRFWGECPLGIGQNWLGRLLMKIRREYEGFVL